MIKEQTKKRERRGNHLFPTRIIYEGKKNATVIKIKRHKTILPTSISLYSQSEDYKKNEEKKVGGR